MEIEVNMLLAVFTQDFFLSSRSRHSIEQSGERPHAGARAATLATIEFSTRSLTRTPLGRRKSLVQKSLVGDPELATHHAKFKWVLGTCMCWPEPWLGCVRSVQLDGPTEALETIGRSGVHGAHSTSRHIRVGDVGHYARGFCADPRRAG